MRQNVMRTRSTPLTIVAVAAIVALMATSVAAATRSLQEDSTARPFDPANFGVDLEPVAEGFDQPVFVTDPGDGSGRLFVVEQTGRVRILEGGAIREEPFLDLSALVSGGYEQGLLSLAFAPDYPKSGVFYVFYTDVEGDEQIARYRVSADDPNRADPESAQGVLSVADPYPNHNGGLLLFGQDGMLYVGLGDGGAGGDPEGNGQNRAAFLGKILRIDVANSSADEPYAIPRHNPYVGEAGTRPEIWAYGLRNPWRFSFDRATGDLYLGDVGQGDLEEIDFQAAGQGGANFGWDIMEGSRCFSEDECSTEGITLPVAEYDHEFGCSVTGGYVYRGPSALALRGVYLFADYCSGNLWGLGRDAAGDWAMSEPIETGLTVSSFGEDAAGELYVTDLKGGLYRVVEARPES